MWTRHFFKCYNGISEFYCRCLKRFSLLNIQISKDHNQFNRKLSFFLTYQQNLHNVVIILRRASSSKTYRFWIFKSNLKRKLIYLNVSFTSCICLYSINLLTLSLETSYNIKKSEYKTTAWFWKYSYNQWELGQFSNISIFNIFNQKSFSIKKPTWILYFGYKMRIYAIISVKQCCYHLCTRFFFISKILSVSNDWMY